MRSLIHKVLPFPHQYFFDLDRSVVSNDKSLETIDYQQDVIKVFDLSQNFETIDHICSFDALLPKENFPYLILSPNPHVRESNIYYFPVFYLHGIDTWPVIDISDSRKYQISCLNRNPHTHRKYNFIKLFDKKISNALLTFYDLDGADTSHDFQLEDSIIQKYNQIKDSLPKNCPNDLGINHPAFTNSYINLVTETVMHNEIFLSEKIWKPIAAGQLFLVIGPKGTIDYLRTLGVDVFDDLLDHSYDGEDDWMKRIDQVHTSLDKILELDLFTVWQKTYERRLKNQTKFFSGYYGLHYVDAVCQAASASLPKY